MSRPGRRPLPNEVKRLRGNPGHRKISRNAVVFEGGTSPPKWLDRDALTEWKRLAPQLSRNKMLTPGDRAAFTGYAVAYSLAKRAHGFLQEVEELHIQTGTGGVKVRPEVDVLLRSLDTCRRFLTEFGMTPSARSRIDLGDIPKTEDARRFLFGAAGGDDDQDEDVPEAPEEPAGNVAQFKGKRGDGGA